MFLINIIYLNMVPNFFFVFLSLLFKQRVILFKLFIARLSKRSLCIYFLNKHFKNATQHFSKVRNCFIIRKIFLNLFNFLLRADIVFQLFYHLISIFIMLSVLPFPKPFLGLIQLRNIHVHLHSYFLLHFIFTLNSFLTLIYLKCL